MSVIVTDTGFAPDDWTAGFATMADLDSQPGPAAFDLVNTDDPSRLSNRLADIQLIRIAFPAFNDGRGFTLGRRLRKMGFTGRLRAAGPVIADQYAMFRRTGFDEVEIPDEIAERQPEDQWLFRADWRAHDYQARLRA
ncbi:MAG: oxidoreductase [Cereibacter sphaeroides]|uniref:Oxidoreductase n=1 Tax=Cereibacter sphaeroides TaxID=1063 RepID=A0A2W5SKX0_CERSP|nr:MAG: oxidoreductase [Cereibacter sphaeroides]